MPNQAAPLTCYDFLFRVGSGRREPAIRKCRARLKAPVEPNPLESVEQAFIQVSAIERHSMKIRAGYDITFTVPQSTSMILMLSLHPSRTKDLLTSQRMATAPNLSLHEYRDIFGNVCTRVLTPAGTIRFYSTFEILDSGRPDEVVVNARQHSIDELPDDALIYLLGSRYCDTQKLSDFAWRTFANSKAGWDRVQTICNFVHDHIKFGYAFARNDRTAFDAYHEQVGVCRDFTHLAVALCRCMNIPARYCTGYLGDIGVPPDPAPMDFSAWFEVFLEGRWFTFDARHNRPRIGRVVIARGRDAADVAISTSFGPASLTSFQVITEEVASERLIEHPSMQLNVA
jgi:transglutaminase-like putative cysteine protease